MNEIQHNVIMAIVLLFFTFLISIGLSGMAGNWGIQKEVLFSTMMTSLSILIGAWIVAKAMIMKK